MMSRLVEPHGGVLVDRLVPEEEAAEFERRARRLPRLELDAREVADLELIATGSPLTGFLGSADYRSVIARMRLADGTAWPIPITLAVGEQNRSEVGAGAEAALHDVSGRLWGTIEISELFSRDALAESLGVYRTADPSHPGVGYLLSRPACLAAGSVRVLPLPADRPLASRRLTPRRLREEISARGWRRVAGFQTRNPIHRAHEHLTKLALEFTDGLVIHPLIGETKDGDVSAAVRFQAYEVLLDKYYPKDRTVLSVLPANMRYAGPREAIFHAIIRKNYGCTHFIVGRDHAGVGSYYGTYGAHYIFDNFTAEDMAITPLFFDHTFFCKVCDSMASAKTCPHPPTEHVTLSGTKVREKLAAGERPPKEFSRPEVADVLINSMRR